MAVGSDCAGTVGLSRSRTGEALDPESEEVVCVSRAEPSFVATLLLLTTTLMALVLGVWGTVHLELMSDYVQKNELKALGLEQLGPQIVLVAGALSATLVTCLYGLLPRLRALLYVLARWCSPLILLAFFPALLDWKLWVNRELVHLLFVTSLIVATKALVQFAFDTPAITQGGAGLSARLWTWGRELAHSARAMRRAVPKSLGLWLVLAGVGWYAVFFSYYTIVHHRNVLSASLDLGLEDNLVWNVLHGSDLLFKSSPLGGPKSSHLGYHATWFAFLIAPFYALYQSAESLLVIQAILMGSAAIPLYLLARRYVSTLLSILVAFAYLFYPGLHGANLYDFHYLPLGPFFLWFVLYFIECRKWLWVVLFAIISCSIREDVALSLGFLGGLWLLAGRRPVAGLFVLLGGIAYFVLMKGVVMHRALGSGDAFVHQYKLLVPQGDRRFSGVVKTILSNPLFTLSTMLEKQKLVYSLQILLPLAFFPLRRPIGFWAIVPGLLFTLFSTEYAPVIMISFQYTTYWSAQLFPTMLLNLRWMDGRVRAGISPPSWKWSWMSAIAMGAFATSYQYGALLQNNTTVGGFGRYHFGTDSADTKRRADLAKVLALIPRGAKVVATENVVPQLSNRPDAYTLRIGIFDADYIVFRLPTSGSERQHVVDALERKTHGILLESGEFVLAKRGHSTEKNARYISRMGGHRRDND